MIAAPPVGARGWLRFIPFPFGCWPWWWPVLVSCSFVLLRLRADPVLPWGGSWEYAPFVARLVALQHWGFADSLGATLAFDRMDYEYPPGLHLLTLWWGQWTGQDAESVPRTNLLWIVLWAAATARIARRLGLDDARSARAGALLALVPSVHGAACRYYYDLPMAAALFAALLIFVEAPGEGGPRRLLAGVGSGAAFAGAALLKWTAAPLAAICVGAVVAVTRRPGIAVLSGATAMALLLVLHGGSFEHSSLDHMGRIMAEEPVARAPWLPDAVPTGLIEMVARLERTAHEATWHRLLWYPCAMVSSHLGLLAALPFLAAAALGLWRMPRPSGAVLLLMAFGTWLFMLAFVKVLDERFVLTVLPALTIAAAVGQSALPKWLRAALPAALILAGLELHFGRVSTWNTPFVALEAGPSSPVLRARGLMVATSQDGLGWLRRDEQGPTRGPQRRRLWERVRATDARSLVFIAGEPLVHPLGDEVWLRYEALADKLLRGRPETSVHAIGPHAGAPSADLLLIRADSPSLAAYGPEAGWGVLGQQEGVLLIGRSPPLRTGLPR